MSLKALKTLAVCLLAAAVLPVPAAYASKWMIGGGGLVSRPDDGLGTYFSRLGFGGGIFFSVPLSKRLELEADGLYFHRAFGAGKGANTYKFSSDFFEFPLLLRATAFDLFSVAGGLYYSSFVGPLHADTPAGSYVGSTVKKYDYGYLVSARVGGTLQMPVFLEYRYAQGLLNQANTGKTKYFEIQLLFGVPLNRSR